MSATAPIPASIDRDRVAALTERMRTRVSRAHRPLGRVLRAGQRRHARRRTVRSSRRTTRGPSTSSAAAARSVWDVDGNEYLDFHNGFGVMCVGHANPIIAAAVKARMDEGTHFAAPTEGSIIVAEELRRRWGLPHWRFTNSGTESTMDAIHLARGFTGRDIIVKIEGTYHGHHDAVMVSVKPPADADGRPRAARTRSPTASATPPTRRSTPASCRSTTPTRSSRAARRARRPGGRRDHGAGDDEHQHRPAGRRLPRARARAHARARRGADLRRGQDRRGRRRRRRDRAVRRHARRRLPGQGDLRRPARRRGRHDRRARPSSSPPARSASRARSTATR